MHVRLGALVVGVALFAAGCAGADKADLDPTSPPSTTTAPGEDSAQPSPTPSAAVVTPTPPAPSATAAVVLDPRETRQLRNFLGYEFPPAPQVPTGPLSPAAADQLDFIWSKLRTGGLDGAEVSRLAESGDARLAWILSDILRFVRPGDIADRATSAFEELTGARLSDDPAASRSPWQSLTDHLIAWDLPAFDGYADYKGRLFTLIEPGWQPFFEDTDADIDWRLVSWGGVLIDARDFGDPRPCPLGCIPALDDPGVTEAEGGSWYPDDGIVFAVVIGDEARAYPRHIMEIHEMVNDELGGRRIGMPYCTLCGSAQVYFTDDVPDGVEMPVLRTSGLLSRSNKVMFDLVTKSVFDTFTGRAVSGPLYRLGLVLPQATVVTTTWGDWKAAHPGTTIVAQGGGVGRVYPSNPLGGRDDHGPIFPVGDVDERLGVQDQVFGVVLGDGTPVAFPVEAAAAALRAGEAVELSGVELRLDGGGVRAFDADGDEITGHQAFWFAWSQFMADTLLWER